jgi:polysaccharide export outer membrane protein
VSACGRFIGRIRNSRFSIQFRVNGLLFHPIILDKVSQKKMSVVPYAAFKRLASPFCAAIALILIATAAGAQTPAPSQDQLNALKNLTQEQQDALLQSVLGKGDGTNKKSDSQLDSPETVQKKNDRTGRSIKGTNETRNDKTIDGHTLRNSDEDPELRADDYVLIDLTPVELDKDGNLIVHGTGGAASGSASPSATTSGRAELGKDRDNKAPPPPDFGRLQVDPGTKTGDQIARSNAVRDRILKGNPYQLNRFGVLEIPGLPSIPLAGLTADEATRRLSADPDLRDYTVKLTLLRLEPRDDQGAKPFGYDLFQGVPSTFAPVKDIQVPIDYVVGPGDTFNVQLYGNETASYSLTVGRDGRIKFPKLGPILVSGMGFDAARDALEHRVSQQLIGTQVSVTMGDLRSIRVFVLGEAEKPGSYTVSGLSTMTNALFVSGGVKTIGSLRNIELKRNGHTVSVLDLYDLLLRGNTSGDHQLMPGDVIFIPPIGVTATVYGGVRRPAIYELKKEKTAEQLVEIAGGLSPDADAGLAQLERIESSRLREMHNINLNADAGRNTEIMNGDKLRIPAIRPTLENSVELSGFVFRPGAFQYRAGLRLTDVLGSFDELRPEADRHYVLIRRVIPPDQRIEVISADLERALSARGSAADPELQPRDRLIVFDLSANRSRTVAPIIADLKLQASASSPSQMVAVIGDVRAPGLYPLETSMHVSDLIRAGGSLEDSAYTGEAELNRNEVIDGKERQTELLEVNLAAIRHHERGADLELRPYDVLLIKKTPQWESPGIIVLTGELRHPGKYPIHHGETLSSVLRRAGGLTDIAFGEGAVFIRDELKKREKEQLETLSNRLQSDLAALSLEAVTTSAATNGSGSGGSASQALAIGQQLIEQLRNTKPVGRLVVDIPQVMNGRTGATGDVLLRDGDELLIPKKTQEITILGEVQSPTSHIYRAGLTRDDYIARSGGTTRKADRKRIYIVRANGDVVSGERSGWFRRSQSVDIRPGDTIVVPLNTERVAALPLWTSVTTIIYNLAIALLAIHSVQP